MRTYSNFLLFEDILDNLPPDNITLASSVASLNTPSVRVVEEDCGTLLGTTLDLTPEVEGLVELATGNNISRSRIETLLGQGKYKIAIRDLHSCNSVGGICRKCYEGQYLYTTAPAVNTISKLSSTMNIQTDIITGSDTSYSYRLSLDEEDYDYLILVQNGVPFTDFTVSGNILTFNNQIQDSVVFIVRYFKNTSEPLQGYMSRTYTGDLLGMKPLPSLPLLLKESLYSAILTDSILGSMSKAIYRYRTIPSTFLDYLDRIPNKLEKALFILYLYAIYANIQE